MPNAGPYSERVLILAPRGRDSAVAAALLREAGYATHACSDLSDLGDEIEKGAGLAIIADEAIRFEGLKRLARWIAFQPSWSDFPFALLTQRGGGPERNPMAARLSSLLGNVSFIEKPFHPTTLVSVVGTAIRGRRRQYEARARLEDLARTEQRLQAERAALADLNATLEQRVQERTQALQAEIAAKERAQEQLRQIQKIETLGHLTGGVAHDFNNLLAAILGNLELLKKRVPDDPKLLRLINGAIQGAQRGASLTQRLLAFARKQDLQVVPADLTELLQGMRELLERLAGPKVELRMELPAGLPHAKVDANQLELAVLNLAVNARDAMPDGGEIAITLEVCDIDPSNRQLEPGQYLCLRLADTGCGMDAATLEQAIEPFFSTKQLGKGTGLGLSMVHGLAIQLGGSLRLDSRPGMGTTATLYLPTTSERRVAGAPGNRLAPQVGPAVILVVDDDPLIATSTTDMLEDLGHTVIETNSAQEALEILKAGTDIDLLLTDHAMPVMTGLELAEAARRLRPGLPVLLATGYAELPQNTGLNLPRLAKPYMQEQLAAHLAAMLRPSEMRH